MKTRISGLIAAVMALSVFATAGFAFYMPSSASVASHLDADGFTTYSTSSAIGNEMYGAGAVETWTNFGSINSVQNAKVTSGFGWFVPATMQTSESTVVSGMSTVAQETVWANQGTHIYNEVYVPAVPSTIKAQVDNYGSGYYGYSADIIGTGVYTGSIGINKLTNCNVVYPKAPVLPVCGPFGCQPRD